LVTWEQSPPLYIGAAAEPGALPGLSYPLATINTLPGADRFPAFF
jgi:hypothetical protein